MNSAVPFFKALYGTCTGRDIFYALRFHSWGRIIWHLLLLSIITGFITAYVDQSRRKSLFEAGKISFTNVFGERICIDKQRAPWTWVCPAVSPEKPREISLPNGGCFYYTACSRQVPESLKKATGVILVWTPAALALAVPTGNGTYDFTAVDEKGRVTRSSGGIEQIKKVFQDVPEKFPLPPDQLSRENVNDVFDAVWFLFGLIYKVSLTLRNFLLVWFYTLIFMAMYRLLNGPAGRLRFLTLKEMWKCGIYAAFPPMVIASLFPILELPFVTYETVFMIALLIYWMAVIARLERTPFENEEPV